MKKFSIILFAISIFTLSSVTTAQVQGGTFFVDSNTKNFSLNQNVGKREIMVEINFKKPFSEKPTILVSLTVLDIQGEKFEVDPKSPTTTTIETNGLKIAAEATGISRDGFVVKIVIWGNTKINATGGSWIAFEQ